MFLIFTITICRLLQSVNSQFETGIQGATIKGDIILGGLFPVHLTEIEFCMKINPDRGIQRLEAMLFTIQEINNRRDLLKDIKLGARILDTCSKDTYAIEQSLDFIKSSMSDNKENDDYYCPNGGKLLKRNEGSQKIRTVIGGSYSSVSILVASLLKLFRIPQISYASTSAVLSDKVNYPHFARTLPSDQQQARAMAALVAHFNWTYVSTVRSSGDYGDSGIYAFWQESIKLGICIGAKEMIKTSPTDADLLAVARALKKEFSKTRVVVLFTRLDHTKRLLSAVKQMNYTNYFMWIASDGWGREYGPVANNSEVANGALTFEVKTVEIKNFTTYFHKLQYNNPNNPWFKEYWKEVFNCIPDSKLLRVKRFLELNGYDDNLTLPNSFSFKQTHQFLLYHLKHRRKRALKSRKNKKNKKRCSKHKMIDNLRTFKQESKIQSVYDAIYAVAYTLDRFMKRLCVPYDKSDCINKLNEIDGINFYKDLINHSFVDSYGGVVKFDQNGDSVGQYKIYNYVYSPKTNRYTYRIVGEYRDDRLHLDTAVTWPGADEVKPRSICTEECGIGLYKKYRKESLCCWDCHPCKKNEYVVNETICEKCPLDHWPFSNRSGCFRLEIHYMRMDSWFAIIPMILSVLGALSSSGVIGVFYFYKDTPIVRASGRELSFLILSGCLLCYIVAFFFQLKPNVFICTIQRIGIGLGFCIMYASLLTKTNRIARIFESAQKTAKRPPCISPKSQLMICAALISVQIVCNAILLFFSPPGIRFDRTDPQYPVLRCKIETKTFLVPQVYNILLITVCTYYAIKTRKIPENFNESKFIGFTMYTTCIIWLAFITIYFGSLHSYEVQLSTLGISVSMSAWVTLVCLFSPKLYIIFMQPEKNVRKLTMSSTTYRKPTNSSGSFANHRDTTSEYTPLPPPSAPPSTITTQMSSKPPNYNQIDKNKPLSFLPPQSQQHLVVSVQSHSPSTNELSSTGTYNSNPFSTTSQSTPLLETTVNTKLPYVSLSSSTTTLTTTTMATTTISNSITATTIPNLKTMLPSLTSIPSPTLINIDDDVTSPSPANENSNYFTVSSIKNIQEHLNSQAYINENCTGSPFSQRRVKFPNRKTFFTDFNQQNITSL